MTKTLVAYITRSGHTRAIAEAIRDNLAADLFEIRPASPYPEDYDAHVDQSRRERDDRSEPALASAIENIADYDVLFLGFPIWAGTIPAPIRTLLKTHDLQGKLVRPFITHGGYGIGDSHAMLADHAHGARIGEPLVVNTEQEPASPAAIAAWLADS